MNEEENDNCQRILKGCLSRIGALILSFFNLIFGCLFHIIGFIIIIAIAVAVFFWGCDGKKKIIALQNSAMEEVAKNTLNGLPPKVIYKALKQGKKEVYAFPVTGVECTDVKITEEISKGKKWRAIAYFANGMTARCVIRYVFNKDMEKDEVFVTFEEW